MFGYNFFQIVFAAVAIVFLGNGLWKYINKENNQTLFKLVYTILIWGGVLFLSLFPDVPRKISVRFGLGDTLNVLIFFGFVLVFMAIFKLLSSIERAERTISEIVRQQALDDLDKYCQDKEDQGRQSSCR